MKTLRFVPPEYMRKRIRFPEDISRIVEICFNKGYIISESDAQDAWEEYSDSLAASWLILGSDNDVFKNIAQYCKVEE